MKFAKKHQVLLAICSIFLAAFIFRLWGIKETGGTWDEDIYYNSAYHYYFNFKNLDFSKEAWGWNFEHPPVAKYLYLPGAWLSQKLPPDPAFRTGVNYLPLRIESAFMGALTCVLVFLIGLSVFKSLWAGIFAGTILAFLPQFVAFGKLASLESPQTLFLTATLYFFLKVLVWKKEQKSERVLGNPGLLSYLQANANLILLFLFSALAFATRYSSGVVFLWMGLVLLLKAFGTKRMPDFIRAFFLPFSLLLFSLCFLLFSWPWLWQDPVSDFMKSFSFSGQHFGASGLEPFYFVKFLLFTTPVLVLIFAGFSFFVVKGVKRIEITALLLWVVVFASQGLTGLKGGGVRYVIMALPAVAVLAGMGAGKLKIKEKKLKIGVLLGIILYLLANSLTVYPYLMDYYGEGVGLVWGAYKLELPFGFRGEGIKRTVDWLNLNARENAKVAFLATPDEAPALRDDLVRQRDPTGETDYIVALPVFNFYGSEVEWEMVYCEEVAGTVPLAAIYKKR